MKFVWDQALTQLAPTTWLAGSTGDTLVFNATLRRKVASSSQSGVPLKQTNQLIFLKICESPFSIKAHKLPSRILAVKDLEANLIAFTTGVPIQSTSFCSKGSLQLTTLPISRHGSSPPSKRSGN